MGIVAEAAQILGADGVEFKPALAADYLDSQWTLRDALLTACGCHRRAGPLAYWEWEDLHVALRAVRERMYRHGTVPEGVDVEHWANKSGTTASEVLQLLNAVPDDEDVPVPASPTLRPWCDPKLTSLCRIPYIPLAALVHAWGAETRAWSDVVGEFDLQADLSPWDLLRRVDPAIRETPAPSGVRDFTIQLREWMAEGETASPARWLFGLMEADPTQDLATLKKRTADWADSRA